MSCGFYFFKLLFSMSPQGESGLMPCPGRSRKNAAPASTQFTTKKEEGNTMKKLGIFSVIFLLVASFSCQSAGAAPGPKTSPKTVGVILSGCGVMDGAEISEAVLTLLALDQAGAKVIIMAPNIPQKQVVNHLTGKVVPNEKRNVLVEAARIARGKIRDVKTVSASQLDALIMPGGYGGQKHL